MFTIIKLDHISKTPWLDKTMTDALKSRLSLIVAMFLSRLPRRSSSLATSASCC